MTIEQKAREWHRAKYPQKYTEGMKATMDDFNEEDVADLAAFARHLSSQAPGNLSEEEETEIGDATPEERIAACAQSFFEQFKWPEGPQDQYTLVCAALRYARDHYLSGWVAVSENEPELDKRYLVTSETYGEVRAMWWTKPYSGENVWTSRKAAGEYLTREIGTHYAPLPIPPYTPQQG